MRHVTLQVVWTGYTSGNSILEVEPVAILLFPYLYRALLKLCLVVENNSFYKIITK